MKLLKTIFIILLIVTLGELGYYFYDLRQQNPTYQTSTASRAVQIGQQVNLTPTNTVIAVSEEKSQQNAEIIKSIDGSILFYRNWFQNNDNEQIRLTLEQPGVVNTIFTKKGSTIILITNEKGEKISGFTITDAQKFYRMRNNEKVQVPFQEVKTGDKIIIHVEKNLSTNEENLEFILPNA